MANLLDQASIVLTPTAYDDGKVLCAKPSEPPYGDFDFSRNSAATRVNAQGLVENVQILSGNLVQNGDFSELGSEEVSNGSFSQEGSELITNGSFDTDSNWNKQTSNWTISNGYAVCDGLQTTNSSLFQDLAVVNGNSYRIDFTITDSANDLNLILGATTIGQYGDGTHTVYVEKDSGGARIFFQATASNAFQGSIDNVSVREVGQNWVLGNGWSIGEDKAIQDGTGSGSSVQQSNILVVGKTYKITYEILERTQGGIQVFAGFPNSNVPSNNTIGVHTHYIKAEGNTNLYLLPANFIGSITNISVKEVGMDWTLNDWSVGDSLISSGNTSSLLEQPNIYTNVTGIYKTTFKAKSINGTSVTLRVYDGGGGNYETFTITSSTFEDFTLTRQRQGSNSILYFYNNSNAEIEITNISVIEITDDTNLPRINYEGFSYQDALGSEEIVNGDFATDSDWTKGTGWSIGGGNLLSVNSPQYFSANQVLSGITLGKKYKTTINVNSTSGGYIVKFGASGSVYSLTLGINTFIEVWDGTNGGLAIYNNTSTLGNISIDNVSVKEYLGQEVVPDSGCGSWLFEPQSTNLFNNSEDFSAGSWVKTDCSVVSNFGVSPSGQNNASKLTFTTTNTDARAQYNLAGLTTGNTYTQSYYIKSLGEDVTLRIGTSAANAGEFVDIVATSEWQRFEFTGVASSTTEYPRVQNITGTLGVEILVWGAQFEALSYATSYIPTNGAANGVTRNKDVCTNGGSLASINSTEGVLYFEGAALSDDLTRRIITITDGTLNNIVKLEYKNVSNQIEAVLYDGNTQCLILYTLPNETDFNKIAFSYKLNDFKLFVNGVKVGTDLSGGVFAPNTLNELNFNQGGANIFFGKTKALAVWKEALSDEELQSLTTI